MNSTASTKSLQEGTTRVKIRNRSLNYPPLKDFNTKSCSVINIEMPDFDTSEVHSVKFTHEKTTYQYHALDLKQIVKFRVVYMPLANGEGMKLIPLAKELVEEVLKDSYEPQTATIIQTGKENSKLTAQRNIEACVITGSEIEIDVNDYVRIAFELEGIDPGIRRS